MAKRGVAGSKKQKSTRRATSPSKSTTRSAGKKRSRAPSPAPYKATKGVAKLGLPVGGALAKGDVYKPHSYSVGLSCLLFVFPALYAHAHGDHVSMALALVTTLTSFTADYGCNHDPPIFGAAAIDAVCKCDRAVATTFALWVTGLACHQLGYWLVLALLPPLAVLSYDRASPSRAVWVVRHTCWHIFVTAELVLFLYLTYRSAGVTAGDGQPLAWLEEAWWLAAGPAAVFLIVLVAG